MKKPLSYFQYFKGNVKKVLSLLIAIIFSILIIGSIDLFFYNSKELINKVYQHYNEFTFVDTRGENLNELIKNDSNIDQTFRARMDYSMFEGFGMNTSVDVFLMPREDIIQLLAILDIEVDENLIPENDLNQVILDEKIVKNNDFINGESIRENKIMILNHSFKSNYFIGFMPTSKESLDEMNPNSNGYLILPKPGQLDMLNQTLNQNIVGDMRVHDLINSKNTMSNVMGDMNRLFNIITIIVLISIGIGLGISSYVHYFQRRKEFGILSSLGYSDKSILFRINKEILYSSFLAFVIGLLLVYIEKYLINIILLEPSGIPNFVLSDQLIIRILVIPLFTTIFSLIPTWILLNKLDSVSIIEGEY